MIQDIYPHVFDVAYTPETAEEGDFILPVIDGQLYLHEDDTFFTCSETAALLGGRDNLRFLFTVDDHRYYMLRSEKGMDASLLSPCRAIGKRQTRAIHDISTVFILYTAWHLIDWYHSNHFCPVCASPFMDGTDERKLVCPDCGHILYPRINPAVICAVHDKDRLLMTRYAGRDVTWLVLVAGFMEIGESAEDTVRREVLEETGVHVKNIRYFGSQPWGIPGNLTLGFTAELDGEDTLSVDHQELSEAVWVDRCDVPDRSADRLSITAAMIDAFRRGEF